MRLFFKKTVLEFAVKILETYNYRVSKHSFRKLNCRHFKEFNHNYYNNSLKYAANRTLFSRTPVTVNKKSEVFLKDVFSKFEDIGK